MNVGPGDNSITLRDSIAGMCCSAHKNNPHCLPYEQSDVQVPRNIRLLY